jgi:DNA-binding transcriptional LysR family regulator
MEALKDHDLIGFDTETPAIRAIAQRYPTMNRKAFAWRVDSDVAQLAAIRAGFGIGICQVPIAAVDPDLVRVLADGFGADLETWVVMHEDPDAARAYVRGPDARPVTDLLMVSIDLDDIAFS